MDRRRRKFGTLVSANLAGLVGSGQRTRYCDPLDLRSLQVEGWWPSVFSWRDVAAGIDCTGPGDALDYEGGSIFGWHPMDNQARNNEIDNEILFRPDRSEERRVGKECRSRWS